MPHPSLLSPNQPTQSSPHAQKLHKGVIRDEQLYRIKRAQLLAGQLHPAAAVAPAAAAAQQQQQQGR